MRKSTKFLKRFAALFLVVLMSIESFAAVVGDNDGAAFITKQEFEDLKTTLNAGIDRYNSSLDNKIDGVIANFLTGINIGKYVKQDNLYNRFSKTVRWTSIPIQSTSTKYVINSNSALFFQGDGYADDRAGKLVCRFLSGGTTYNDGGSGRYNMFQVDDGKKYYYGYTNGEYCETNYTLSGVFMFNWSYSNNLDSYTFPSGAVNPSRNSYLYDTSYGWNAGGGEHSWYTSTPNTSGWGAKTAYWSRSDAYKNGTVYDYSYYMSSSSVSTSTYRMIDYNNRVGGKGGTGARSDYRGSYSLRYSISNGIMYNGWTTGSPDIYDSHAYFYPETYDVKVSDLYSLAAHVALGRNIYLYQGLPLFVASTNGKVTIKCTLNTSSSSAANVTLYLRDDSFFANGTPAGTQTFDVWSVASDGTKTKIGTDVTSITTARSTKIEIEFETKKEHEYIFKLVPSNTSYYAYVSNFNDIYIVEE